MISIITICKNSSATIKKTIESVLSQECAEKIEYILVDGSSTDDTMDIIRSYGDKISKCTSESDGGISDAFNKGIALADGSIIGILNSDDRYLPGTLAKVEKYFAENPEVEIIHADLLLYRGERLIKVLRPPRYWWIPWRMILYNHPTTFVRRHIYDKYGVFDTSYLYAMDFELCLRWLNGGVNIKYLPDIMACMDAGGTSGKHINEVFLEFVRAHKAHGFNRSLSYIQFITKHIAQKILDLK